MATYGPLIDDGSQTTAGANFSPTAGLDGPSGSAQFLAVKLNTAAARQVVLASSGGETIYGVLQNQPLEGQAADVGILGITKAVAGAAVTEGAALMTDTAGRLITATSTNHRVAYAIEAASGAGIIFTVVLAGIGGSTVA